MVAGMKALTIAQPYASLIACGEKQIETRSWPPSLHLIGETIAIHAARPDALRILQNRIERDAAEQALGSPFQAWHDRLTFSAIICTVTVAGVYQIEDYDPRSHELTLTENQIVGSPPRSGFYDVAFGYFKPGMWAWLLTDIKQVGPYPHPRGQLRLWNWNEEHSRAPS